MPGGSGGCGGRGRGETGKEKGVRSESEDGYEKPSLVVFKVTFSSISTSYFRRFEISSEATA